MIKHVADDQSADAAIMAKRKKRISAIYEKILNEMRSNKKASQLKYNTLKTNTLKTDTNSRKCPILKAYGTPRHQREPKANRSEPVGGFGTPSTDICQNKNNEYRRYVKINEYST